MIDIQERPSETEAKTVTLQVRLTAAQMEKLEKLAAGRNKSWFVRYLLDVEYVRKLGEEQAK